MLIDLTPMIDAAKAQILGGVNQSAGTIFQIFGLFVMVGVVMRLFRMVTKG